MNSVELAAHTGTSERHIREWQVNQAAGGYIQYDGSTGRYSLPPEQAVSPFGAHSFDAAIADVMGMPISKQAPSVSGLEKP